MKILKITTISIVSLIMVFLLMVRLINFYPDEIQEEKAILGLPEVGLGVIPAFGGTQRLKRMIGEGNAKYMTLTGAHITAEEAFRVGIAQKVVPANRLIEESEKIIHEILSKGTQAVSSAKYLVHSAGDIPLKEGLTQEKSHFTQLFESGEANEGLTAFIEKRKPDFIKNMSLA